MLLVRQSGGGLAVLLLLLLSGGARLAAPLSEYDFYRNPFGGDNILPEGDSAYEMIKLDGPPIQFYSQQYDHIYINTNGILTFSGDYAEFSNLPFPIEYAAIAPLYTNVDTTEGRGTVRYFTSQDYELLQRATDLIHDHFEENLDFEATNMFVATWQDVAGRFAEPQNDKRNTFQVAVIWNAEETYVQFLYPEGGINWIQADVGESGLPDVRAQAGFVSEDGRAYKLKGSGTETVRYLTELSNIGRPGEWLFRVGPLAYEEDVNEPIHARSIEIALDSQNCERTGKLKCHVRASCENYHPGFCCACNVGYYGNGYTCIKDNVPLRASGLVSGSINGQPIEASQLQSYIVMDDGRSYTAISPIDDRVGSLMQLLPALGETIGWLFAKPGHGARNGFFITGGNFSQTTTLRFSTGEVFYVAQQFNGLNVWDQLAVDMKLSGELPPLPGSFKVKLGEYVNRYEHPSTNTLRTRSQRQIELPETDQVVSFTVEQEITFSTCPHKSYDLSTHDLTEKVSKISVSYNGRDQALRIGMLNRVGETYATNPCLNAATCGANTVCVPDSADDNSYNCECKNGFVLGGQHNGQDYCVDIDECSSAENICHPDAVCQNRAGGYDCICGVGYEGNGFECRRLLATEEPVSPEQSQPSAEAEPDDQFDQEDCENGDIWDGYRCVPYTYNNIDAVCDSEGCTCPHGYALVEYVIGHKCMLDASAVGNHDDMTASSSSSDRHSNDGATTCDIENNCNPKASCEWSANDQAFQCVCVPGYDGDGYQCDQKPAACIDDEACDVHATCRYSDRQRISVCECESGYEGDGHTCQLAPDCLSDSDCGWNAICDATVCVCKPGFERDLSNLCVPAGSCGGSYCAENAVCQWDNSREQSYCFCPADFVGDGIRSCDPVAAPCNVQNNCGLNAICAPNYRDSARFECICNPGYLGDGFDCVAELNCGSAPYLCDPNASCLPSVSGLMCVCNDGFLGNGSICAPVPKHDSGFLLISQGVTVVRVPFDGTRGRPTSMSQLAIGIDHDCATGRVYWSDISARKIYSAKYDGTDKRIFISDDISSPEGIAVDWISRRLYWTDSTKDTIEVANLDNPHIRSVIIDKNLVNPRGIAVDPQTSKIYWSDWNREAPKIESANLDGTEREVQLKSPDVNLPNSLAINPTTGELCFADAGVNRIGCIDVYSQRSRIVVENLSYPFGLTISGDHFYWTDWTTRRIESVDMHGNRREGISGPLHGNHKMYGMTAITDRCSNYQSVCQHNNGGCPEDRLCLLNPRAPAGRSCACANPITKCIT